MAADSDSGPFGIGIAPPRPLVTGAVGGQFEIARRRLAREPLAQRLIDVGPGVAAIATGRRRTSDVGERRPHSVKCHAVIQQVEETIVTVRKCLRAWGSGRR